MNKKIDFVIPWVDGDDVEWLKEKHIYMPEDKKEDQNRFRDWDNLQYWFRGVEKFAPWVNRIHFVTWGHIPSWLNTEHPKLHIVNHKEYIPEKYLPVFSSHTIEMNFHRIDGLEEQFVYFNDDTFLIDEVSPETFFINDLPNSQAILCPFICQKDIFSKAIANNLAIINNHFGKSDILNIKSKLCSLKNGKRVPMSLLMIPLGAFPGFINTHLPNAYLKSILEEIWNKEFDVLDRTSNHKFRNETDVNQFLIKYWQIAQGKFNPYNEEKTGHYYQIGRDDKSISNDIRKQRYKMICLNDADTSVDFEKEKNYIKKTFDLILPEKSEFEL
jgi:hypothetical protein